MRRNIMAVSVVLALTGCALFSSSSTMEAKLADVERLSNAAASIGTQVAIQQNPAWKSQFEAAYMSLNTLVEKKTVTGAFLRDTLAMLPIKELKSPTARIVIENATFLYDASVGDKVNIEKQPYVNAAAKGIRDGMKAALGK